MFKSLSEAPRIAHLKRRRVVEIAGPDAKKFIKGLFCNEVDDVGGGYSGFLNASGRVVHTTFIIPAKSSTPTYLITHNPASSDTIPPLAQVLAPFKLRSKVRIKDVTDRYDVYQAWGGPLSGDSSREPVRSWKFGSGGAAEASWNWPHGLPVMGLDDAESGCWDLRAGFHGGMGRHIVVPKGSSPSSSSNHEKSAEDDFDLHRMLLGVPEDQVEIHPGNSLPLESCMDIHAGVDFRKGCYLGQELTVRTYHTGATRKRILPISLFPIPVNEAGGDLSDLIPRPLDKTLARAISPDAEITYHPPPDAPSQKPRPAGKILSVHPTISQVGLGMVRLEFAERAWWSRDVAHLGQWLAGGRLTTTVNGTELGVYVDTGEAYDSAVSRLQLAEQ
ncbi:putative transferase CAF17, mitochondrial [Kockovaella imperatae]|uniref:Putative transferase CAF17, mitochondrial n=1 Tax=Kockovaella imperatae TaxID=4999 RepID=A0A1Y1UA86_9TREE|nr:putative transferase CAF17, mitochondrial [Kockovaella imperatae]ORX34961.1 putative transferase CAF17, mitochondrial [Kockovaella imperatae]